MDLDSMKYADLRGLAKELGLKANMKAHKLLKALKQHYQQDNNNEEEKRSNDNVQEDEKDSQDGDCKDAAFSTTVFVNTCRGRGKATKRKVTENTTVTEGDVKMKPNAAQGDAEINSHSTSSTAKSAKRRKTSSDEDCEKTEPVSHKELQTTIGEQQQADTKDEPPACGGTEKAPKVAKAGKIPRYQGLQQKNKTLLKPVTPNFKKLHEAQFNKMESIDTFLQRKTKQMETYRKPVKELKELSDNTKLQQPDGKAHMKKNPARATVFSPAPGNGKPAEEDCGHTLLSASKVPPNKAAGKDVPFRPSILSTRRINVRFSEATCDNKLKRSLVKTPARMSPCMASSTPKKQTAGAGKPQSFRNSTFSAPKTPGLFVFTGNTSTSATPGKEKKPNFDLKASLSRPLTYKPHKGKLKPFGETKENPSGNKSLVSDTRQESYKQHKVQSREERRTKQMEGRKQKKEGLLGARRGLVMM
ncbi:nucleolar and spindle-associated protein 1 [Melanotaenia boesemani]|uniref:nucleolar and spindle-associated protein 1 n=1 Tax=Melanotaenia boesemani TaxID=1250792 RepID=UPI001C0510B4|nr:nucleolar and spindle-associated protein 1 [Melanotaenia boesemani]